METTQGYSATAEYLKSLNLGKTKDPVLDAGIEWKDPLRQFEEIGKKVHQSLRHWLLHEPEDRMKLLERYRFSRTKESDVEWQARLDTRWRDLTFIFGEETKTFIRPELRGRGSLAVLDAVVRMLIPAAGADKAKK